MSEVKTNQLEAMRELAEQTRVSTENIANIIGELESTVLAKETFENISATMGKMEQYL